MKQIIVFLIYVTVGSAAKFESALKVKVGYGSEIGKEYFFDMPRHKDNATSMGWSQVERPISPLPSLVMFCPEGYKLCIMYDPETGYLAGMQIALPLCEFTGATFDWSIQGFNPWTPHGTQGDTYMTKQLYFISEETQMKSVEERMKCMKEGKILQDDKLWVVGFHKKLMAVSTNVKGIIKEGFTKQNCFPSMGTHYFYNMTTTTDCSADTLLNWFLLFHDEEIIGVAFTVIGVLPEKDGERFFFERPTKSTTLKIIEYCPKCLADLLENPTSTTMHIYFIDKPWTIGC